MKFEKLKYNPILKIRTLGFSKNIKTLITGSSRKDKPESSLVINGFSALLSKHHPLFEFPDAKGQSSYEISSSAWEKWWAGVSTQKKHIDKFNSAYNGVHRKWFGRGNYQSRLSLHLTALELLGIEEAHGIEQAAIEAGEIISLINHEWMPRKKSIYLSLSPYKEEHSAHPSIDLPANALEDHPNDFGIEKILEKQPLGLKASDKSIKEYSVTNPLTVIPFIFRHLITKPPIEPGAVNALVIDILTASISADMIFKSYLTKGFEHETPYKEISHFIKSYFFSDIAEYSKSRHALSHPMINEIETLFELLDIRTEDIRPEAIELLKWKGGYLEIFHNLGLSSSETSELLKHRIEDR